MMVVDESTTIKNPNAKRTKAIIKAGTLAKYRRILTGEPVTRDPLDLYSQCEFLDEYHLGFSSFYSFRNRYAIMVNMNLGNRSFKKVTGFQRTDELNDLLRKFSFRVKKDDCLDLPKKTFMKRIINLSPDQYKIYEQMRKTALATLNGKMTTTATVLTQLMRLQQITCGHFKADDGTIQEIKSNRLKELMDILEEVEGKAIIWAHWQSDIKKIIEEIKKVHGPGSVVDYYGLTPQDQRDKNRHAFQNDSKVRFIVGTPQTGGYGITLTAANTVIYLSLIHI
mgnify:CR=1 FL=1